MTGFKNCSWLGLCLVTLLTGTKILAKPIAQKPENLVITYLSPPEFKNKKDKGKFVDEWKAACESLGKGLTQEKGIWGSGVFQSITCTLENEILSGQPRSANAPWVMEISHPFKLGLRIELFHMTGKDKHLEAMLQLPSNDKTLIAMKDREVGDLLALKLLDQLPMSRVMTVGESETVTYTDPQPRKVKVPKPPAEFTIYTLQYEDERNQWIPTYAGTATLKSGSKAPKTDPAKKGEVGSWEWTIKLDGVPRKSGQTYWAQDTRGRGKNEKAINAALGQALEPYGFSRDFLTAMLFDTLASGYVGIRYGYPVTKGDPLISKSTMVSVFAEVRGGPMKGLRWYWDMAPEVKATVENQELTFGWSRPTLGWSFGMNFESKIINRVDIVPKIGVMDFKSKVPLPAADPTVTGASIVPVDFNLKNATSFGGELGIESATDWFLMRLWGASDIAGLIDTGGDGTVSSIRGGIDTYWDFVKLGNLFESSLLIFAVGERISLSQRNEDTTPAPGTNQIIRGLSYNLAFVGMGITLTW